MALFQAASLLKETKGMVNLVVCNPNKAKEEERKAADGKLNAKGSTARSPTPTQPAVPEKPSRFLTVFLSWL